MEWGGGWCGSGRGHLNYSIVKNKRYLYICYYKLLVSIFSSKNGRYGRNGRNFFLRKTGVTDVMDAIFSSKNGRTNHSPRSKPT
jgi:hypothetical protein